MFFDRKPMCLPSCWALVCSSLLRSCFPGCVSCASNSSSWIRAHLIRSALHHTQIHNSFMSSHKLMNRNTGRHSTSIQAYLCSACKQPLPPLFFLPDCWLFYCVFFCTSLNLFHFYNNRQKCASLVPRSCSCWQSGQRHSRLTSGTRRWSDTLKTSSTG